MKPQASQSRRRLVRSTANRSLIDLKGHPRRDENHELALLLKVMYIQNLLLNIIGISIIKITAAEA